MVYSVVDEPSISCLPAEIINLCTISKTGLKYFPITLFAHSQSHINSYQQSNKYSCMTKHQKIAHD